MFHGTFDPYAACDFNEGMNAEPIKMIIQGTAGTGNTYILHCISQVFSMHSINGKNPSTIDRTYWSSCLQHTI